jgi:serine/threonine protein kinase
LGRKVAIKEYFPSDFAKRAHESTQLSVFSGDASSYCKRGLASFLDEARRLAAFARQGNIVAVHDTLETHNPAYIVMEYLEGRTLKELLREKGKLGFSEAMSIITPVLDALVAVHGAGIIHRDVAPDNIFIREDGSVTLIDFGAARAFAKDANRSMTVVLKPGYAPTEQYLSKGSQGPWTDVYATAATLYRILTGVVPEESIQRSLEDGLVPPSDLGADLPLKAEGALMAALVVKPEQRTRDIATLKAGLSGKLPQAARQPSPAAATKAMPVAVTTAPTAPAVTSAATPADRKKSNVLPFALTFVFLVIMAAAALFSDYRLDSSSPPSDPDTVAANDQVEFPSVESVGQRVEFGTWRGKPITWRVLAIEDDRALVISENILAARQYDDLGVSSSDEINWDTASTTWAESDIRAWLNGEFLDTAFTAGEQRVIDLSKLSNPDNPAYGTEGGTDTEDKVFLLSIDEVNRYFSDDSDRIANITMAEEDIQYMLRIYKDYLGFDQEDIVNAEDQLRNDYLGQSEAYWWWLRSPGIYGFSAAGVGSGGTVHGGGYYVLGDDGVRPALWLNL